MSNIHKVLNVLLRGLVIYAVLGLECTYSDDLPSQPSDAANVANTGKPVAIHVGYKCLQFIYACTPSPLLSSPLLICLPHLPLVPCGFLGGKPRKALRTGRRGGSKGKWCILCRHSPFFLPPPPPLLYIGEECMTWQECRLHSHRGHELFTVMLPFMLWRVNMRCKHANERKLT